MKHKLLIAAALSFCACTQMEPTIPGDNQEQENITLSFSATHEQSGEETRTELQSGGSVLWSDGDRIKLVWNGGSAASEELDLSGGTAASATFTASVPSGATPAFAVYPSGIGSSYDGSSFTVTVPATQDGSFASAAIEVATAGESGGSIALKNLGALLEMYTGASVSEIVISAYGSKEIAGSVPVTFSDGLPVTGEVGSDASSSITLSGLSGTGPFYAAILPGTWDEGLYIELRSAGSVIGQKFTGKTLTASRKGLIPLGTIAATPVSGTFVKTGGSGDGSDWDHAMSLSSFLTGIKSDGSVSGNVFIAEGTYTPSSETSLRGATFKIYGGYSDDSEGTDLSKRDITLYPTIFDGGGARRLFVFNSPSINATFDGITFQNAYRNYTDQGSAIVIQSCASATFNNCSILNNKNVGTGSGGAVRANKGTISFTKCLFSGNTSATSGGAISHASSASTAVLSCEDCSFTGNYALTTAGVFYEVGTSAATSFTGCTFSGNGISPDDESVYTENGGVVNQTGTSANTLFEDCSFTGNAAQEGGVVYATAGSISSSGCSYSENKCSHSSTSGGGGCYRLAGSVNLTLSNDIFDSNYAYSTLNSSNLPSNANNTGACIMAYSSSSISYVIKADKCLFMNNISGSRGIIRGGNTAGKIYLNACTFYANKVYTYASAVHSNGTCGIHNCTFQLNQNASATGASSIYVGGGNLLMTNSSIRMSGKSGTGLYSASGPAWIANNTVVNSDASTGASEAVALKSKQTMTSYGHNIYSKLYEETASTYVVEDSDNHADVQNKLSQTWRGDPDWYIYWSGSMPSGFVQATPARVEAAIDAFATSVSAASDYKAWLQGLSYDGGNALETDVRGVARSTSSIWPGSYDNSAQ